MTKEDPAVRNPCNPRIFRCGYKTDPSAKFLCCFTDVKYRIRLSRTGKSNNRIPIGKARCNGLPYNIRFKTDMHQAHGKGPRDQPGTTRPCDIDPPCRQHFIKEPSCLRR